MRVEANIFQSTLPMRGATAMADNEVLQYLFQSTLPMRGATRRIRELFLLSRISIHTPHAGSDRYGTALSRFFVNFNPHSPCGERRIRSSYRTRSVPISIHTPHAGSDSGSPVSWAVSSDFNPHSPCGERRSASNTVCWMTYFNPHSPCGERLHCQIPPGDLGTISIHTPHAGSDPV